jgi:hypothetical protein
MMSVLADVCAETHIQKITDRTLSLEVMDARAIPLKKLVEFRKREQRGSGSDYSGMRRRYLAALQKHIATRKADSTGSSETADYF